MTFRPCQEGTDLWYKIDEHTWLTQKKPYGYGPMVNSAEELLIEYDKLVRQAAAMRESDNLCTIIYTELTDYFEEVNSFITMDRKVVKIDVEKLRKINMLFRDPSSLTAHSSVPAQTTAGQAK